MTDAIKSERWVYFIDWEEGPAAHVKDLVLLGYDHFSRAMPLTSHVHEEAYEFVFIEQGTVVWEVNGQIYPTSAQHIIHTRPGERHRASFDYIGPCTIWWINVRDPLQHANWFGLDDAERQIFAQWIQRCPRIQLVSKEIVDYFKRVKQLINQQDTELVEFQIRHGVLEILQRILHHTPLNALSHDMQAYTLELKTRLEQNPSERYTIGQLASEIGLSESHFYRVFRETNGQSPTAFMDRIRMDCACHMLEESKLSITDIAMELGFKTSQHFATVFKKLIGVTPKAWRTHSKVCN
ncbi:AraC family transcriptional regulator [Paenibacillus sp.]|uniref:AraC family transcriptional regulator n=1 Tax=Paenibacillus sp. TaxID=58172 RepID=UPI0028AA02B8|nr:AraC family transcriptional regulator [Paenibacillus sp.]